MDLLNLGHDPFPLGNIQLPSPKKDIFLSILELVMHPC